MIGKLTGTVNDFTKDSLIMDVNGVGYLVFCSNNILSKLNEGDKASLIIETFVREDQISLYGFLIKIERDWFKKLITIKGVGNKVALSILSAIDPYNIATIIISGDKKTLSSVPGIGGKLSERIISELKNSDILDHFQHSPIINLSSSSNSAIINDAISALVNLGYSKNESFNIANKILSENTNINLSNLIKRALKELSA